jgi:hypothetical protein
LEYYAAIWYIFHVLVRCTKKNLATLKSITKVPFLLFTVTGTNAEFDTPPKKIFFGLFFSRKKSGRRRDEISRA